jgi:hypothetical protein
VGPRPHRRRRARLAVAVRLALLSGIGSAAVSLLARASEWPFLTATLGPTLYVFIAHPFSETARIRNAILGHATAVAVALGCLAVFGLRSHPALSGDGHPSLTQVGAVSLALGLTLGLLHVLGAHMRLPRPPACSSPLACAVANLRTSLISPERIGMWAFPSTRPNADTGAIDVLDYRASLGILTSEVPW